MVDEYFQDPRSGNFGDVKKTCLAPLSCWDVTSMHADVLAARSRKKRELQVLKSFQNHNRWNIDLDRLLDSNYEALILTDSNKAIQWVNGGFTQMSGYNKGEVIGKNPKMLQGVNTSRKSLRRVQKHLNSRKAFSEELINYRKNGEEYLCRVEIHPIFNSTKELSHYLAMEQEVKRN